MAISFPLNPTTGDTYTAAGKTWTWNGAQWEGVPASTGGIPSGETGDRPSNPAIGDQFYNGTLGVLEIYTSTGWLPATGANDFNVVLTGSETAATLDKDYFPGAYTIFSALNDQSFDIYLLDGLDNAAGYSNTPSINATGNFNKIIVYGGTAGDLLSFSYKTTFTTSASTTDTVLSPYVVSVSATDLPNVDDTLTITGGNFANDIQVFFEGANSYSQQAKSVVYGSSTSIVVTRPDNLIEDNAPYSIRLVNPNSVSVSPTGSNRHIVQNITAGADPIWSTPAGSISRDYHGSPFSFNLAASDESDITYTITSGALPAGLSFNSSTGEISGNSTEAGSVYREFTVQASDQSGNASFRSFNLGKLAEGGTEYPSGLYIYHAFTSNSTFQPLVDNLDVEFLLVAGGGGGGTQVGGGGGAGGLRGLSATLGSAGTSYSISVGAGGAASPNNTTYATSGQNSSAFSLSTSGGGRGGNHNLASSVPASGGSGGGGGGNSSGQNTPGATGNAGGYNPPEGFAGGNGYASQWAGGGGGGATQAGLNAGPNDGGEGGNGSSAYSDWGLATSTGENVDGTVWYAGGGGGCSSSGSQNSGGFGGGGNGASNDQTGNTNGSAHTGGGGGAIRDSGTAGNGGSGVVVVRYLA